MTTPVNARRWTNWGQNQESVAEVLAPAGIDEVAAMVTAAAQAGRRIKTVGTGHSFTAIAVAEDQRMLLHRMTDLVAVDGPLVTVQAGMPLSVLNAVLAQHGLAMPNLGDIDVQTVAGAISTATHGTGIGHGTLASCVEAVTLVTAAGKVERYDPGSPEFPAVRAGLGALGVLVEVTLRCVPAFTLLADEKPMALADVLAGVEEWVDGNDHVEFFWYPYTDRASVKINNRVPEHDRPLSRFRGWLDDDFLSNTVFQGVCKVGQRFPGSVRTISSLTARALSARSYTDRSDRVFCSPRRVTFTEMEYEIPRAALPEVIDALPRLIDALPFKVLFPVEVRFTGPDDVWLSHGYGRESAYIAVHQFRGSPYEPYFKALEALCEPLGGRPHWGKMHYRSAADLRPAYPRFDDFLAVRDRLDPARVFTNAYLDRVLGA
ncbi:FAD-linked oxidoreductase [Actinoplanes sp. SE50]|uniref:D-arabinono-1,4-lactone oxidase n=1 Tax=unclassified Actinoplanes TaxID=2626549 RepID=UPI00023EC54A|nr:MULTISPECIES: D-arabinono-1,4-lactone oxidase [unclassified Actinoplanes]AEV81388.1 FAD-linked oxidoreductase [Actinoplanes sp. SE50/110]ATO79791.1 FAD-linked oxidoreductase [Actinoplanes sp. SE50]SLL97193.1 FAD-linked oxidoreductase [Actinoplanes sp. SE50/110]